ncbi:MAG: hypothetical protein JKY54_19780 [Flavobacteriales bacterium]|nr:hypothetical protein [Flavobacteriales bacterium]
MGNVTITPSQALTEVMECIDAGLVPYIKSSPGLGKSSIAYKIAKMANLFLIDVRLSQCTPEDLQGYPMLVVGKAQFVPFDMWPLEGQKPPEGYDGWLILFDELSSARKDTQAAAYKVILDKMIGSFRLSPMAHMMACGNLMTDKAVVVPMSTALTSRLINYTMVVSVPDWTKWAQSPDAVDNPFVDGPRAIDHRIISFVNFRGPQFLMSFDPNKTDDTFACPRTYEFLDRLIYGKEITEFMFPRIAGTISEGVGTEFITYAKEFHRLPNFDEIIKDPDAVMVPAEKSTQWATMGMLVSKIDDASCPNILKFMERFDIELQIVFLRGVCSKHPKMRKTVPPFVTYVAKMVKYLN